MLIPVSKWLPKILTEVSPAGTPVDGRMRLTLRGI
jgi:hypothetical protein